MIRAPTVRACVWINCPMSKIDDLKLGVDNQERDFNKLSTLYFSPIIEIKNILKKSIQSLILMITVSKR